MAVAAATAADAQGVVVVGGWVVMAVAAGAFAWHLLFTFTEVGVDALVVRKPPRRQTVKWAELAEVQWHRESQYDVLVFRAVDGREVKAAGVVVTATGLGEQRMLRLRDDVKNAWAAGTVEQQRHRLLAQLATALRSLPMT
ncbi:hypothetical protein [Rhizocola hellebori]|nr:hypothetical protein [Rhizocola hellebori]